MQQSIDTLRSEFQAQLDQVKSTHDLENLKVKFLGKKGPIQRLMQPLREVSARTTSIGGKEINDLKEWMVQQCETLASQLTSKEEENQLAHEKLSTAPCQDGELL